MVFFDKVWKDRLLIVELSWLRVMLPAVSMAYALGWQIKKIKKSKPLSPINTV